MSFDAKKEAEAFSQRLEVLGRFACLLDELETSHKLVRAGFGSLQEIDMANDFYHLPHQLLASGFERLMKSYISLVYEDHHGSFPNKKYMKALGHDLEGLLTKLVNEFYGGTSRPFVRQELEFITSDNTLKKCIRILSLFGKFGRYYNLDIVAGSKQDPVDPKKEWEELEYSIEDVSPFVDNPDFLLHEYYPRVHAKLIAKMERLVRAIAFQFTCGDHQDQFGRLGQTSSVYADFRNLRDEQLGTIDYRRSVHIIQQKKGSWVRRTEQEILDNAWPTRIVTRAQFGDDWPFRADRVIVECQEKLFCIVNIEGYDFALNGAAASRRGIPFPHDAGVAILGKSVGPFTTMALELGEAA